MHRSGNSKCGDKHCNKKCNKKCETKCSEKCNKNDNECEKLVEHEITLVSTNSRNIFIDNTEFTIKIDIESKKLNEHVRKVTLYIPEINFQIIGDTFTPEGYIATASGFLPDKYCPLTATCQSTLAASYNGMLESFLRNPLVTQTPINGYILQINDAGALSIQGVGQFGNTIPAGGHALLPTTISYLVRPAKQVCSNLKLSLGPSDATQFNIGYIDGFRDSHVNDAFDNVVAWTWQDNSNIIDKSSEVTNVNVAIGKVINGKIKNVVVTQLTNYTLNNQQSIFDTAVAINRTDKNNIVVSWGNINFATFAYDPYVVSSMDGGLTWTAPQIPQGFPPLENGYGDCLGVKADKYGNFWYSFTDFTTGGVFTSIPNFYISQDKGLTWRLIYAAPNPIPNNFYDYPQFSFGNDANGQYGINFVAAWITVVSPQDLTPFVGFIPIPVGFVPALASTDTGIVLNKFVNQAAIVDIASSNDGRVWTYGTSSIGLNRSIIIGTSMLYKSPGALNENYSGNWTNVISLQNISNNPVFQGLYVSQPQRGYLNSSTTSIIYDDDREALYTISMKKVPDFDQNSELNFLISRNNGQTWSDPIKISNTNFANRGFQSMALDPVSKNLVFGWYDGRHDPTFKTLEYYSAIIDKNTLDKLVASISLSNPILLTGDATANNLNTSDVTANINNINDICLDDINKIRTNRLKRINEKLNN